MSDEVRCVRGGLTCRTLKRKRALALLGALYFENGVSLRSFDLPLKVKKGNDVRGSSRLWQRGQQNTGENPKNSGVTKQVRKWLSCESWLRGSLRGRNSSLPKRSSFMRMTVGAAEQPSGSLESPFLRRDPHHVPPIRICRDDVTSEIVTDVPVQWLTIIKKECSVFAFIVDGPCKDPAIVPERVAFQRPNVVSLVRKRDLCRVLDCDRSDDGEQDEEHYDHWGLWNRPQTRLTVECRQNQIRGVLSRLRVTVSCRTSQSCLQSSCRVHSRTTSSRATPGHVRERRWAFPWWCCRS